MALQIGIVGLPNVGKSTLFNALTRTRGAQAANYPFCTIDPNVGVVAVPDERLRKLGEIVQPDNVLPAAVEFKDIAGLVKGAHRGEGLGNAFLSHIREVHALCHVVRLFPEGDVIHIDGSVDPKRDREVIEAELCLADLATTVKKIAGAEGAARTGNAAKQKELAVYQKLKAALDQGKLASTVVFDEDDENAVARSAQLLTRKPFLFAANASEKQLGSITTDIARQQLGLEPSAHVLIVCAKLEEDLQDLTPEEGAMLLRELGVQSSGLDQLIRSAYDALGYASYFTAGPKEVRAWAIKKGSTAPQAAGIIHTDFERGFIRAETISYKDFVQYGGELGAKNAGKLRVEGKDYVVQDGDVLHFRFNV